MFNPKIFIPLALTTITAGVAWFTVMSSEVAILTGYPNLDPKVAIKAHRKMLRRTLRGDYRHLDMTDEVAEKIFMDTVHEITK